MASAGKESFKQDLVVSIRYRNELPPPPMPPKFLDIDTGGIQQYLTPSYASALIKREEPNIDVDAEGGMPIDMVGIPGYFLGDESAIMAPDVAPTLDPADAALMLSLEQLKSQSARNNVSFLRKNQYLSSSGTTRNDRVLGPSRVLKPSNKNPTTSSDRNDKDNIKKAIQRGFDTAYAGPTASNADRDGWLNPKHPDNPRAKPVAFYPIIPDLETGTDVGNWNRLKFEKPPLPPRHSRRDDRIDNALIMAVENKKAEAEWLARRQAYEANPKTYEDPGLVPPHTYILSVPENAEHNFEIRKALYADSGEVGAENEVFEAGEDGVKRVPFTKARVYTTVQQTSTQPNRYMALGLYDPASKANTVVPTEGKVRQGPAAYFYPIAENIKFKQDRARLGDVRARNEEEGGVPVFDRMMVGVTQASLLQKAERVRFRGDFDSSFRGEWVEIEREVKAVQEEEARLEGVVNGDGEDEGVGGKEHVNGDGDEDADGEVDGDGEVDSPQESRRRREDDDEDEAMDDD
jgi:hypothetical protein